MLYDYQNNVNVTTTAHGDKVITMSEEIFTEMCNYLYDASEHQKENKLLATSERTMELWKKLVDFK